MMSSIPPRRARAIAIAAAKGDVRIKAMLSIMTATGIGALLLALLPLFLK